MSKEAMKLALEALEHMLEDAKQERLTVEYWNECVDAITALREALAEPDFWEGYVPEPVGALGSSIKSESPLGCNGPTGPAQQEPVGWVSVKDALPKAVRGVSYKASLTDVVLVRHLDRPDYPITAHAVVGENLGAGVAISTDGASEHPEIAWYSASSNLNNPFDLKNDNYDRYMPKIFGSKITHWMPITTSPQRNPLTDEEIMDLCRSLPTTQYTTAFARAIEAAHGIGEKK